MSTFTTKIFKPAHRTLEAKSGISLLGIQRHESNRSQAIRRHNRRGYLLRRLSHHSRLPIMMASTLNGSDGKLKEDPPVIICGAGIIGASIAYYLSRHGISAQVFERTGVACAASGKAGGFLALDWSDGSPTGPLQRHSFRLHQELAERFGAETIGYRRVGALSAKTSVTNGGKAKQTAALKKLLPSWLDQGVLSAQRMSTAETTAQVHPEKLTQAFLREAEACGTRVTIGTVEGVTSDSEGRVTGVRVDGREVAAKCVVVAMGPWTKSAAAWFEGIPKIQAQKAHSIVMQPSGDVSADCLFLAHTNKQESHADPEVYPRPDGSVYICGEAESVDLPEDAADIKPRVTSTASLREVGAAISSSLAHGLVLKEQACFLPLSPDGTPAIGTVPGTGRTLYVASGHSCWGILNAPATGEAIAAMIANEAPAVNMSDFDPSRFVTSRRYRMRGRS